MVAKGSVIARIISQYSDKGSKAAIKDLTKMQKKFGDFADKAAKRFGLATAAAGVFAGKIAKDAVSAALADQKAQSMLANTLRQTTKATEDAIVANEKWISKTALTYGITEDLHSSLGRLSAVTGDIENAQRLLGISLDIAAAKEIDVATAADLVAKGYRGNLAAMRKMFPQISAGTVKSQDFAKALQEIGAQINGAAAARANSFSGQIDRLKVAFNDVEKALGYKLLPALQWFVDLMVTKAVPAIQDFIAKHGDQIAAMFKTGLDYGIAFSKFMYDLFSFISRNSQQFMLLGQTIIAVFIGVKTAVAAGAIVKAIEAIIVAMKALTVASKTAAIFEILATGGISLLTGGIGVIAFAGAMKTLDTMVANFANSAKKSNVGLEEFKNNLDGSKVAATDYAKGLSTLTKETKKLTDAQKADLEVQKMKDKIYKKFGIKVQSNDLNTLGAVWNNLSGTNFAMSSPTISLAASAGANGTIGGNTSGTGSSITVNVAGSVVSENDLVQSIANGLETLQRRSGYTRTAAVMA